MSGTRASGTRASGTAQSGTRAVGTVLAATRRRLAPIGEEAALEAELLLVHASGRSRTTLRAWPEATLAPAALARLDALVARRLAGEPYAYLVGRREFHGHELEVGPAVLVPRPDTETLVERALAHLEGSTEGVVVDAGTGSGAVAIALAAARGPDRGVPIVATELSAAALAVARRNAARLLPPGRVAFVRADWLAPFADASVALLVSNPPYLAADDPHLEALAAEPRAALVAGPGGLEAIDRLLEEATRVLRPGRRALLEHGATQGTAVRALFARRGFVEIRTFADLGGLERVTEGALAAGGAPRRSSLV